MEEFEKILNDRVQEFMRLDSTRRDFHHGIVKNPFPDVPYVELMGQIKSLLKAESKLPHLYRNHKIVYPAGVSIEQCSTLSTSRYKATLVSGERGADLTGGFGIDSMALSDVCKHLDYYEINEDLARVVQHNFAVLEKANITLHATDGLEDIAANDKKYDFIYLDPARRDDKKDRVYRIEDCSPNVLQWQDVLLESSRVVMTKLSPMVDISLVSREMKSVKEIHVVALKGEVKEILVVQERGYEGGLDIFSVDIDGEDKVPFVYKKRTDVSVEIDTAVDYRYLYDVSAAMRKAGVADDYAASMGLKKVGVGTFLYTSGERVEGFAGRAFEVVEEVNRKSVKKLLPSLKANVVTRNYPMRADELKRQLKIKDGSDDDFVIGFSSGEKKYHNIYCRRIKNS
ncbi:MAG: class I SAM-dependent methyltransferase [Flavobacteriales bacterium]|nr:class I SAM-dependent methyltransferase [Flavobacteriales bacterium]